MSAFDPFEFVLGGFHIARVLRFTVLCDHRTEPNSTVIVLDDGVQAPYTILTISGLQTALTAPETVWRAGWTTATDPWSKLICGNAISVIRQARSCAPTPSMDCVTVQSSPPR